MAHGRSGRHDSSSWRARAAAVALVVTTAPAAYVVMPDQSTTHDPHPDYYLRPPAIAQRTILTVGLVALTVAVIAGVTLVMARRIHTASPRLVGVTVPLVAVGVIVAVAYRVMTARVIGANIGAGLAVVGGGAMVLALTAVALYALVTGRPAWRSHPT